MLAKARARMTFANVTSLLALFVALGGTAYAAATIGSDDVIDDSLLSEDIKNATIKGVDVAPNTLSSTRVIDGTLLSADVQDEALTAADIKNGTIGSSDVGANSLGGGRIADNSLKGADIDEGSLSGIGAVGADPPGENPPPSPTDVDMASHTIDVPSSGTLLVQGWANKARMSCFAEGDCSLTWGLYVDGQPVPGSAIQMSAGASESAGEQPVSTVGHIHVEKGTRKVSLALDTSEHAYDVGLYDSWVSAVFVQD
jgi:hypothetical protein